MFLQYCIKLLAIFYPLHFIFFQYCITMHSIADLKCTQLHTYIVYILELVPVVHNCTIWLGNKEKFTCKNKGLWWDHFTFRFKQYCSNWITVNIHCIVNAIYVKALHGKLCMLMVLTTCDYHIRQYSLCSWLSNTCMHACTWVVHKMELTFSLCHTLAQTSTMLHETVSCDLANYTYMVYYRMSSLTSLSSWIDNETSLAIIIKKETSCF